MALTKEHIIKEALIILNELGIDNLSMRELALRLNIKASSIYWHIKNKEELYHLIADHICKNIPLQTKSKEPREVIIEVAKSYRENLLKTRDSVHIFAQTPPQSPARIALIKKMLINLEDMGVENNKIVQTGNLINNYVLSFVADEIIWKHSDLHALEISDFLGFPYNLDFDEQFEYGLEVILCGLKIMFD